jgi:DNA polymerase III sliding clamp (beta) subunit (PCNA family)
MKLLDTLKFEPSTCRTESGNALPVRRAKLSFMQIIYVVNNEASVRAEMEKRGMSFDGWDIVDWNIADTQGSPKESKPAKRKTQKQEQSIMQITTDENTIGLLASRQLTKALQDLGKIIYRQEAKRIPIFGAVLLEQKEGQVKLSHCNTHMKLSITVPGGSSTVTAAIDHKQLLEIAKAADANTPITIQKLDKSQCKATYTANEAKAQRLVDAFDVADYPYLASYEPIEQPKSVEIPNHMRDTIYQVVDAASRDPKRYILNSIYFDQVGDQVVLTSTDAKKMHVSAKFDVNFGQSFILPSRAVIDSPIFRNNPWTIILGKTKYSGGHACDGNTFITIQAGQSASLSVREMDGRYPNYKEVMKKRPCKASLLLDETTRELLKSSLKNLPVAGENKTFVLGLNPGSGVLLESKTEDGKVNVVGPLAITVKGECLKVAFNRDLFIDILDVGHTKIDFASDKDPLHAESPNGMTSLLMPVQLA